MNRSYETNVLSFITLIILINQTYIDKYTKSEKVYFP